MLSCGIVGFQIWGWAENLCSSILQELVWSRANANLVFRPPEYMPMGLPHEHVLMGLAHEHMPMGLAHEKGSWSLTQAK